MSSNSALRRILVTLWLELARSKSIPIRDDTYPTAAPASETSPR